MNKIMLVTQRYLTDFYSTWIDPELIFAEISYVCVLFTLVYLFNKYSPAFSFLVKNTLRQRDWLWLYGLFTLLSILGTFLAIKVSVGEEANISWAMVNIRTVGAVLAGLLGGPFLGACVGFSAGFVYLLLLKYKPEERFSWKIALLTTLFVELLAKVLVFIIVKDPELLQAITFPMILANCLGVVLCVGILHDYERLDVALSGNAFDIARQFTRVLKKNTVLARAATELAQIVKIQTGAAAVAFTDRDKVIAFVGLGEEHHHAGDLITNPLIKEAVANDNAIYVDSHSDVFLCKRSGQCPLHSAHITRIRIGDKTEGTLVLFESKKSFFPRVNQELVENLASLLAEQMVAARYPEKLATLQDKYLLARVNPHFFGNALATISAVTRKDVQKARMLMGVLAELMRERVSPTNDFITLKQEIDFLKKYLLIEQERFEDRLHTEIKIDKSLESTQMPQFILQLLVENAIKHGVSKLLPPAKGLVEVSVFQVDIALMRIEIKDNVGAYYDNQSSPSSKGAGMKMVNELIKSQFSSEEYGLEVDCKEDEYTLVSITLPIIKA